MILPDESAIRDALAEVEDPKAGVNIVDLGLVWEPIWNPSLMSGVAKDHCG